ncbi:unnamed protein product [Ectocarpus sp. 12 AP-2014]
MGINEVTKFLEATAAAAAAAAPPKTPSSTSRGGSINRQGIPKASGKCDSAQAGAGAGAGSGARASLNATAPPHTPPAIVLICRDVRPARLVEHVHALVALTATPCLVLSEPSSSLGGVFGCKTMAALAICPARTPPPPPQTSSISPPPSSSTGTPGQERGEEEEHKPPPRTQGTAAATGDGEGEEKDVEGREGCSGGRGEEEEGREGEGRRGGEGEVTVSDDRVAVDEGVDSFVDFLRRKVRAPSS